MKVNVLDYTIGGVLSMECEDRKWRLIAYLSKSLNKTERNYKIYSKNIRIDKDKLGFLFPSFSLFSSYFYFFGLGASMISLITVTTCDLSVTNHITYRLL